MRRVHWFVIDLAVTAAALALADLILSGVTATASGIAAGTAILTVPTWLAAAARNQSFRLYRADPDRELGAGIAAFLWTFVPVLLPLPLLLVADVALSTLDIDGPFEYIATIVLLYAVDYVPYRLGARRWP